METNGDPRSQAVTPLILSTLKGHLPILTASPPIGTAYSIEKRNLIIDETVQMFCRNGNARLHNMPLELVVAPTSFRSDLLPSQVS